MVLVSQSSTDSAFSAESWTTGESSRRSSESGPGYGPDDGCARCIATLAGHSGAVGSLAVVGGLIYSGGSDGSDIRVWRQPDLQEVCSFGTGEGAVKALLSSGGLLFSAHQDMKIRVWKAGQAQAQAPGARPEPKLAATLPTMKDYLLRCVPPKNYVQVRRHKKSLWIQHNDTISVLARGAGNVLYSGSWDKTVKVWRTSDFRCVESIVAHDDAVSALAADQGGYLYTGSADATVKVWGKVGGKKHSLLSTLKGHKSSVNALAFSPDEKVLYSASSDKTVAVWERAKGGSDEHMTMAGVLRGHRQAVLCLATVGNIVVTGSADKTIRVWRRGRDNSHSCIAVLEGHKGPVKAVVASMEAVHEGVLVYSGGLDRLVKVWYLAPKDDGFQSDVSTASPLAASPLRWRF
ncbi:hypothetical protein MPTK1_7g17880 [Marchantia polymorpha subsp. ruderalis]|uniref:Anaphase-promoting complex subunit 4 WD40 domain-containing protein n=2 Tax=Marchantia polymorpha TaxID=3197 RepID=A0AAF6C0W8_MARPO|nr:hypothetical protein MARPO_0102s0052 [Marchantia polymorpha]BBN17902.1 hypothetical protein Mp_7g17880 [Marchantia polymorpha subsp. ruderalis]|eukprot:PTQ32188.1 hypothetical protein MARPO_0102s0052 [Marchantia polymorpha]